MIRRLGRGFAAAALVVAIAGLAVAADPAPRADTGAFDKTVRDTLADVHNTGADLYNVSKDYAGAYRLYEGALRTVRPLLVHRPKTRAAIDAALSSADREADPARRAFLLHEAIESVRAELKEPLAPGKTIEVPEKTVEPKKKIDEPKKVTPPPVKIDEPKKQIDEPKKTVPLTPKTDDLKPKTDPDSKPAGRVSGKVTYKGKPVAGVELMFSSLGTRAAKVVTVTANDDGAYFVKALPPGKYAVAVTGGKLPKKFGTVDTSGLTVEVKEGYNDADLDLK